MESELIEGLKSHRIESIQQVYNECFPGVRTYVLNNSGSVADAQDLFQDGLIVLYENINKPNFRLESKLCTYLYSICDKIWKLKLKRKKLFHKILDSDQFSFQEKLINSFDLEHQSKLAFLRRKIFSLDEKCKELLVLTLQEVPLKIIAERLNYKYNHAKKKKHDCKKALKKKIKEDKYFKDYFE